MTPKARQRQESTEIRKSGVKKKGMASSAKCFPEIKKLKQARGVGHLEATDDL